MALKGEVKKYQINRVCNCGHVINGEVDGVLWPINGQIHLLYNCPHCETSLVVRNFIPDKSGETLTPKTFH
jgi:hypothetical protein